MKILADENIPNVVQTFNTIGQVTCLPNHLITSQSVRGYDILLLRSVTQVNALLLENSSIRLVGSATSGIDHLDTKWLSQQHIAYVDAQGANALAVSNYVICVLAALIKAKKIHSRVKIGIIGVGKVGSQLAKQLQQLDFVTILHDPPLGIEGNLSDADVLCIHTPLTTAGDHPTYHLLNQRYLSSLKPGCVIINAARGDIIDPEAVLNNNHLTYCFDVWPNEPDIDLALLDYTTIATPHIAGYSKAAKLRATALLFENVCKALNIKSDFVLAPADDTVQIRKNQWQEDVLHIYDPMIDTKRMKETLQRNPKNICENFSLLRNTYIFRQEFYFQ